MYTEGKSYNMRDIKFRAWVDGRGMYKLRGFVKHVNGITIHAVDSVGLEMEDWYFYKDIPEIMEYTSMKDSKGVDIYEGDIVSMLYAPQAIAKGVIKFEEGSFRFLTEEAKPNSSVAYDCVHTHGNSFTVIGNVYENSELTKIRG